MGKLKSVSAAILLVLFSSLPGVTQKSNYVSKSESEKFWFKQTKVQAAIEFERSLPTHEEFMQQNVGMSRDYYPLLDKYPLSNPIISRRKAINYLPLYAEYYFSTSDSIIRLVFCDWEMNKYGNYFDNQKIWKKEASKLKTYNEEYERIKELLILEFGKPINQDSIPTLTQSRFSKEQYYQRQTFWDSESIHAGLDLVFATNTYRIRSFLYWK